MRLDEGSVAHPSSKLLTRTRLVCRLSSDADGWQDRRPQEVPQLQLRARRGPIHCRRELRCLISQVQQLLHNRSAFAVRNSGVKRFDDVNGLSC
eukprot:1197913-Rhodomonas_salina.4